MQRKRYVNGWNIPYTGKILRPTTSDQNYGVFLEVVAFSHNIRLDRLAIRKLHLGNFTLCGVWLLGLLYGDVGDDAFALEAPIECRRLGFPLDPFTGSAHDLV
jgi:hypothetical protein